MTWRLMITKFLLVSCLTVVGMAAHAAFPDKPIRLIVPYAAGGSTDAAARIIAEGLSQQFGVPVVIHNRPGASGFIGASAVARSEPDGYTLLLVGSGIASAPSLKNVPFDLKKDLIPISKVVSSQFSILVNPSKLPFNSLRELLDHVRANPGKVDFACPGAMTAAHFALEGFRQAGELNFMAIQYSGNAPAAAAMMTGEPAAGIDAAFSGKTAIASGRLRALAVTGSRRSPLMPDVPTAAEAGLPGYTAGFSLVMMGPSGMSRDVVMRIYQGLAAVLKGGDMIKRLEGQGYEVIGNSPEEFATELDAEIRNSAKIIDAFRANGMIE